MSDNTNDLLTGIAVGGFGCALAVTGLELMFHSDSWLVGDWLNLAVALGTSAAACTAVWGIRNARYIQRAEWRKRDDEDGVRIRAATFATYAEMQRVCKQFNGIVGDLLPLTGHRPGMHPATSVRLIEEAPGTKKAFRFFGTALQSASLPKPEAFRLYADHLCRIDPPDAFVRLQAFVELIDNIHHSLHALATRLRLEKCLDTRMVLRTACSLTMAMIVAEQFFRAAMKYPIGHEIGRSMPMVGKFIAAPHLPRTFRPPYGRPMTDDEMDEAMNTLHDWQNAIGSA